MVKLIRNLVCIFFAFAISISLFAQSDSTSSNVKLFIQKGNASYYARKFEGRRTANGEKYRRRYLTAAHKTLPFNTKVKVSNPKNGRWVIVRINDRGPFHKKRIIVVQNRFSAVLFSECGMHPSICLNLNEETILKRQRTV